jgi:hypothetical protein
VDNGRIVLRDAVFASPIDIVTVAFDAAALDGPLLVHPIEREFVAGLTVYDDTNEVVLPDSIRISGSAIEVDLTSFLPLTGIWHLVYLG